MAYGDLPLDAPCKSNKGYEGGACNRQSCQAEPALHYNHGSYAWYCADCARAIGDDWVNRAHWASAFFPKLGHPQFETREAIAAREAKAAADKAAEPPEPPRYEDFVPYGLPVKPKSTSLQRLLKAGKRRA